LFPWDGKPVPYSHIVKKAVFLASLVNGPGRPLLSLWDNSPSGRWISASAERRRDSSKGIPPMPSASTPFDKGVKECAHPNRRGGCPHPPAYVAFGVFDTGRETRPLQSTPRNGNPFVRVADIFPDRGIAFNKGDKGLSIAQICDVHRRGGNLPPVCDTADVYRGRILSAPTFSRIWAAGASLRPTVLPRVCGILSQSHNPCLSQRERQEYYTISQ